MLHSVHSHKNFYENYTILVETIGLCCGSRIVCKGEIIGMKLAVLPIIASVSGDVGAL